jgi:hypothetical protein
MKPKHCLSDDMISAAQEMFLSNHHWIVYNGLNHELGKGDMQFFKNKREASQYTQNKTSEHANYKLIYASSILDLIGQLTYGNSIGNVNDMNLPAKTNFMKEENLNYLKTDLKYLGFGDRLQANLEHNIRQGFPEFVLRTQTEFGSATLDSILYFSRSNEDGKYYFNRHDARLKNDVGVLEQSFHVNKGHGITLKEAFNLLEGRAVYKEMDTKEGERYHAWIQLDFQNREENGSYKIKQFHDAYGYDLGKALSKFPLKELSDQQKTERLLMSLQKGNLQAVTMMVDGKEQRFSIGASPQYKTVDVYDYGAVRPLTNDQKAQLMTGESRKRLNGKKVEGEQTGKELSQQHDDKQSKGLKNGQHVSQELKGQKTKGVKTHR